MARSSKNGLSSTRRLNVGIIINAIRSVGQASRQQIARMTALSVPTVWRLSDELLADGIVRELPAEMEPKKRGPKTSLLEINPRAGWVAALDISSEHIRVAALDMSGAMLEVVAKVPMPAQGRDAVASAIAQALAELMQKTAPALGNPLCVGVSSIGMIDSEAGVLKLSFHLQLKDFSLAQLIRQHIEAPVEIRNDVASAAFAEARLGLGRLCPDFAYITVGTGINANYVFNDQIYNRDYHSEFGLMIVAPEGDPERFEGRGFLESLASGRAIADAARRALSGGVSSRIATLAPQGAAQVTHAHVVEAARQRDPLAVEILARAANYLAIGIVNLANILSLRKFVIGGSVPEAGDAFWKPLREAVQKYEYWAGAIELQPSGLRENAALLGAGLLALDQAFAAIALRGSAAWRPGVEANPKL